MRAVFGILGLLVVLAVVGITVRQQLASTPAVAVPGASTGAAAAGEAAPTPQQQVQQFKQAIDAGMQQARPMPDDVK